jgi:hypothetical protein
MRKLMFVSAMMMAFYVPNMYGQISISQAAGGPIIPNIPITNTNVGILNTNPLLKLDINTSATNDGIRVKQTASSAASLNLEASTGRRWALFSTGTANGAGNFALYDYGSASLPAGGYRLFVHGSTGNVGIGTSNTTPTAKLHTLGTLRFQGLGTSTTNTNILTTDANGNVSTRSLASLASLGSWGLAGNIGTNPAIDFIGTTDAKPLNFRTSNGNRMIIDATGKVGIGTTNPTQLLQLGDEWVFHNGGTKYIGRNITYNGVTNITMKPNQASSVLAFGADGSMSFYNNNNTILAAGDPANEISRMTIDASGNVGIGNDTPSGQLSFTNNIFDKKIVLWQGGNATSTNYDGFGIAPNTLRYQVDGIGSSHVFYAADAWTNATGSNELMRIQGDGNVVIGQNSGGTPLGTPAGYKLFVKDGILTEKVKVALATSANWADYVFADDYKLKPLSEVEAFVKENRHLPNVPSAEQLVKEGGIDMNEMFSKQMEKIEELTLYSIEQNKKADAQSKRIQQQQTRISQLEKQ